MSAFERRTELLSTNIVPGQHETINNLSESLGRTVLNTMSPIAQDLMGVTKPLSTAPLHMWIDPADHLAGEIVVRPPTTAACLKAFTHQKIMEFGMDIERKVQSETAFKVDNATGDTAEFERFVCNQKVDFAVKQGQEKLQQCLVEQRTELLRIFQDDRQQMIDEHEEATKDLIATLQQKNKLDTVQKIMELRQEQDEIFVDIEKQRQEDERKHLNDVDELKEHMNQTLQTTRTEYFELMKKLHAEYKRRLDEQKQQLQCQHMCELMHAICAEKTDAQNRMAELQKSHQNQQNKRNQATTNITEHQESDDSPSSSNSLTLSQKSKPCASRSQSRTMDLVQTESDSCNEFLQKCINDAATKSARSPFVIGACEMVPPPSVSVSLSSVSTPPESSISSLEYENRRYIRMTTTAIDPRLLRSQPSGKDDENNEEDVCWKIENDNKSIVSLATSQLGSMNNLILQHNETTAYAEIRAKLFNILDIVNQLHPITDAVLIIKNLIGTMINELIDNTDSPMSSLNTPVLPVEHSKLLSTTDSHELISLRKPLAAELLFEVAKPSSPIQQQNTEETDAVEAAEIASAKLTAPVKHLQLDNDEYFDAKKLFPTYLRSKGESTANLFNYTPTSDAEWKNLIHTLAANEIRQTVYPKDPDDVTDVVTTARSETNTLASRTAVDKLPNPILRKGEKSALTVRNLLELLEHGDDDVAAKFFGTIPKAD